jgi:hypothetical protein
MKTSFGAFFKRAPSKSPDINVVRHSHTYGIHNSFLPNPDQRLYFQNEYGDDVGYVSYAVSPLHDRLYIHKINVYEKMMRKGYGTAILKFLQDGYEVEICPIQPVSSAFDFWQHARSLKTINLGGEIGSTGIAAESKKWAHLYFDRESHIQEIESRQDPNWFMHEFGQAPEVVEKHPTKAVYEALLTRHFQS